MPLRIPWWLVRGCARVESLWYDSFPGFLLRFSRYSKPWRSVSASGSSLHQEGDAPNSHRNTRLEPSMLSAPG